MAARENQGLQIALIIFVILSIATSVTTYLAFTNFKESEKKTVAESQKAAEASGREDAAKQANADLIAVIGNGSNDAKTIKEGVIADFNSGKYTALGLGATTPDDQKTLTKVITELTNTVNNYKGTIADRDKTIKDKDLLIGKNAEETLNKLKQVEAARDLAVAELDKERTNYKTAVDALKTEKDTLVQEKGALAKKLDELKAGYEGTTNDLKTQLANARADVAKIKDELKKYYHLDPSAGGGMITWINQRDNMAYINLGWDEGIHRRITFSVYQPGTSDVAKAVAKGKIEVVNVTGPHEAEARIIDNPINNPLLPRDMIHTQGWHPGQHEHFGITGFVDIDGVGHDQTSKLVDLITSNGGIVDAKIVEAPGGEGKKVLKIDGKMTVNTRFLIMGDMLADSPAKVERATSPEATKLAKEATNLNIETIGLQKFLSMMGYTARSSAAGGGTTPAASAAGTDDNGFRPRKPPARGKDDSAF
jgi:hypothetical protein